MIDAIVSGAHGWLISTLITTTLLCGVVLLLRRPVARYFGPQAAYALWALPALRMILPPLPYFFPNLTALLSPAAPDTQMLSVAPVSDGGAGIVPPLHDVAPLATATHEGTSAMANTLPIVWSALPSLIVALWGVGVIVHGACKPSKRCCRVW